MNDSLVDSIARAVRAAPYDLTLRVHYGRVLLASGRIDDALACASVVLETEASHPGARELMIEALSIPARVETGSRSETVDNDHDPDTAGQDDPRRTEPFDWATAERDLGWPASPTELALEPPPESEPMRGHDSPFRVESPTVLLSDVGGMVDAKRHLEAGFLAPLRNPELRVRFGLNLRGGLMMYGPPGCGKTYLARAIAGQLGARFLTVDLAELPSPVLGVTEQAVHELFQLARREAPCVLFLDELDALGARRTAGNYNTMRGVVHQLLVELDGIANDNDDVFVLSATNRPWDIDPALRRPGRIDRTVLVLPPDRDARAAILRSCLRGRAVDAIDIDYLAGRTQGLSGADLAYLCEAAAERALLESLEAAVPRRITMIDLVHTRSGMRPSTSVWDDDARRLGLSQHDDGTHGELRAYLKRAKRR